MDNLKRTLTRKERRIQVKDLFQICEASYFQSNFSHLKNESRRDDLMRQIESVSARALEDKIKELTPQV